MKQDSEFDKKVSIILENKTSPFERLVLLMEVLRMEGGCNWDRAQTHESLLPYLIEEAYEVFETIESDNLSELKEELGDLICQVVFHAQIAKERGDFTVNDSITHLVEKLIRRHPHVFGENKDLAPDEVRDQWEKIKISSGEKKSVLSGLPKSMPALTMAFRIGEKAGGVGFDWDKEEEVLDKIDEELKELKEEIFSESNQKKEKIENELGDLLFAISSLSRKLKIDPELALKKALHKFRLRFNKMEEEINEKGEKISELDLEALENIWQKIKNKE